MKVEEDEDGLVAERALVVGSWLKSVGDRSRRLKLKLGRGR